MSLPVVLRAEAEEEFDEAFDWYDAQRAGLGPEFAEEAQRAFDSISINPLMHSAVFADIRKRVVRRFPYCVFYRPHESHHGVSHQSGKASPNFSLAL